MKRLMNLGLAARWLDPLKAFLSLAHQWLAGLQEAARSNPASRGADVSFLVLLSQPRLEGQAVRRIADAGHEVFYPRIRRTIMRRGRRCRIEEPLFPRYLMVREAMHALHQLLDLRGIVGYVKTNDLQPAQISDEVVETVRVRCTTDGFLIQPKDIPRFQAGQRVRPREGALMDLSGIYSATVRDREYCLMQMFGRQVHVSFTLGQLIAA